uniref:AAA domain-containing protein n=1 Tax=Strongyloides papillosus TaxID=174720 RepID=A0A0N5BIF1_STREA
MGSDDDENSYRRKRKLTRIERLYGQRRYTFGKPQTFNHLLTKSNSTLPLNKGTIDAKKIQLNLDNTKKVITNNFENSNHVVQSQKNESPPVDNEIIVVDDDFNFFDASVDNTEAGGNLEMEVEEGTISIDDVKEINNDKPVSVSDSLFNFIEIKDFENHNSNCTGNKRPHSGDNEREEEVKSQKMDNTTNEKRSTKFTSPIRNSTSKKSKSKVQPHHEPPKFVTASNKDPTTIDHNSIKKVTKDETNISEEPVATSIRKNLPNKDNKDADDDPIIKEGPLKGCERHLVEMIEREIMHEKEEISWESICGLEKEKNALMEAVVWPMVHPEIFDPHLRKPDKGILLFGPPGTGKTMLAKCVASQSKATFFNVSASSLSSKWHGESEKLIRTLFTVAAAKAPSVVFIDEIDSFLSKRSDGEAETARKVKTEFLVRMDGVVTNFTEKRVMILAASNKASEIDEAARRRFTKRLLISLPSGPSRRSIITKLIDGQHLLTSDEFDVLVDMTDGFSGSDVALLCTEASMYSIREIKHKLSLPYPISKSDIRKITFDDFKKALKIVKPTVSEDEAKSYNVFAEKFASNFKI